MEQKPHSPRVTHLAWGRLEVEGQDTPFKDVRLFPGGAREWDWRESGTSHTSGIQPADVEGLLERGASVVVLSQGFQGRLQVCPDTLRLLQERAIPVHMLGTEEAVRVYNQLSEQEPVGALIHTTC